MSSWEPTWRAKDNEGSTPLRHARRLGRDGNVEVLVRRGAKQPTEEEKAEDERERK